MDIVKRAYLKIKEEMAGDQDTWEFHERVRSEMVRLIKVRVYSGRDWPSREFGPLPDELRSKGKGKSPKHTELDEDKVRELWQSGEGMMQNPINKPNKPLEALGFNTGDDESP